MYPKTVYVGLSAINTFLEWALFTYAFYPTRQPENAWATSAHPTRNGVVRVNFYVCRMVNT